MNPKQSPQAPSSVVMIRPRHFRPNPDTASDNAFQARPEGFAPETLAATVYAEVTNVAAALTAAGITVHVFDDDTRTSPDSVFPNNWFSTHTGGHVATYPMFSPTRRLERRADVIELLKRDYRVQDVIDYSGLEYDDVFLEGTGAMVLDHVMRVAYTTRSRRADPIALERFCTNFGYEPLAFDSRDASGIPIYHTNVLMCIATDFALVGLELIPDPKRRAHVRERLAAPGREIIELTETQIKNFAGNAIELQGRQARYLVLSERALGSLTTKQLRVIEQSAEVLPLHVPTIELAGGSARCMIAGIHLEPRSGPRSQGS